MSLITQVEKLHKYASLLNCHKNDDNLCLHFILLSILIMFKAVSCYDGKQVKVIYVLKELVTVWNILPC